MARTDVNFLDEKDKVIKKPKNRKLVIISKIGIIILIIFVILLISFGIGIISSGESLSQKFGNLSIFEQIKGLIGSDEKTLEGEADDRINILLLGIGGSGHDGPYLSDTIIISSIKPSTKQVSMISVPRDLLVPIPGYGWWKINHASAYGQADTPQDPAALAIEVVEQVFSIPIHYYIRVDFEGFVKMIDDLGGISVEVKNTLDDERYPIKGKETATTSERYEHLYVEAGLVKMDGSLALKFVRSRQARGAEGSDFARSQRQQTVLMSVKDKALSLSTLANPYKLTKLMDTLSGHIQTNLQIWEIAKLFQMTKDIQKEDIATQVFDDGPEGYLYAIITEQGAFVLKTKAGDFSEIQLITKNIFNLEEIENQRPRRVEIQNGTKINGLAYQTSQQLQALGYQVIKISNAPTQDYQKTVVYDLTTNKSEADRVKDISETISGETSLAIPNWVYSTTTQLVSPNADILIILGQDQNDL